MKQIEKMNEKELIEHIKTRMPAYRTALNSAKSFVVSLLGANLNRTKNFLGLAADATIDVSSSTGVKSQGKIDLTNFKAPNATTLKRHINILSDTSVIDELRVVVETLSAVGSPSSKKRLNQLRTIYNEMQNAFNDSMEILSDIANNHVPKIVVDINNIVKRELVSVLKQARGEDKVNLERTLLINVEKDRCAFSMFYDVEGDGSVFVVVSSLLEKSIQGTFTIEHFISHTNRVYPPLHHEVGSPIHTTDAKRAAAEELSYLDILPMLSKHPVKYDRVDMVKRIIKVEGVKNAVVLDDDLEVSYDSTNVENILAVYSGTPEVAKLLRKGAKLDYHIHEESDGYVMTISVVGR